MYKCIWHLWIQTLSKYKKTAWVWSLWALKFVMSSGWTNTSIASDLSLASANKKQQMTINFNDTILVTPKRSKPFQPWHPSPINRYLQIWVRVWHWVWVQHMTFQILFTCFTTYTVDDHWWHQSCFYILLICW